MFDTDKFASLSNEEYYALTGTLNAARIEQVFAAGKMAENLGGIKPWLEEAEASYPEEDFMEGIKTNLLAIIKVTKGVRKAELQVLLEQIDDLALTTFYSSEYGREQLQKIRSLLHD